jgi:hypothetical protein
MTQAGEPRRESIPALARRLVGGLVQLARLEVTRGRQEIGEMLDDLKVGAIFFGIAAGLAFLAVISIDVFFVLGVTALFEAIPNLVVVIIIVACFVGIAIGFAVAGLVNVGIFIGLLVAAAIFAVPAYFGFTAAWLSAIFVLVLQLALATIFAMRGVRQVHIGPPEETIAAVKEDITWAKRLLRRG